jgi:adenosine kinase
LSNVEVFVLFVSEMIRKRVKHLKRKIAMQVVVTGSIAYDYLMSFPGKFVDAIVVNKIEKISLSFLVNSLKRQRGGIAPNIAYTMALLGGRPKIMATAGKDFSEYRAWLDEHGVDTSSIVEIEDEFCASFFVNTDEDFNQIASFYPGAMAHAGILTFAEFAPEAELAVITPNDPDAMQAYVAECQSRGLNYVFDPSQQTVRMNGKELRSGLTGCFLLTANEYEFSLIQQKTGLSEADILDCAGGLLVTKGADGSWFLMDGQEEHIPAVPPDCLVDPTGAGDAYRAGLLRGIQLGLPPRIAGRIGALAATYALEHIGSQKHSFTPAEFVCRFRQHFDDEGALDVLLESRD